MKIKKEYLILAAVIIALSLYLSLRNPDRTQYQLPKLASVNGKDISKIEIIKGGASIVLVKKGHQWRLSPQGFPADAAKVNGMLDTLGHLTLTALVSESKDYTRYDLNKENAITVKAWSGGTLSRDLEVGKAAPSYRHTFVKLAGDPCVYHARGSFRYNFDEGVDGLMDKTVLSFDKDEVREIHLKKGSETISFSRKVPAVQAEDSKKNDGEKSRTREKHAVWETAEGRPVDPSKLNTLLSTLSGLRCEKLLESPKKEDLKDPIYTADLKGKQDYSLSIFPKKDKEAKSYPAISSGSGYAFLLPEQQGDNLMKAPGEMLEKQVKP